MLPPKLTHLDESGRARMVDVSAKDDTERIAIARGEIVMQPETLALIRAGSIQKGDVLTVAQVAGIMAAKKTAELIPLCHPLPLTVVIGAIQDRASIFILPCAIEGQAWPRE